MDNLILKETIHNELLKKAVDGISVSDPDGKIIIWNAAMEEISGIPAMDALGQNIWDIQVRFAPPGSDTTQLKKYIEALFVEDRLSNSPPIFDKPRAVLIYMPDGSTRKVEQQPFVIQLENGAGLASILRDVTDRQEAQDSLRAFETEYQDLFNLAPDAVFVIRNSDGRILEANFAAEAQYGYSREELLKLKNTDLSAEPKQTRQATEDRKTEKVTIPIRWHKKKDGTIYPVEITASFSIWRGEDVHLAICRDVTERIKSEKEFEKNRAQLEMTIEAVDLGTWSLNITNSKLELDERTCRIFGIDTKPGSVKEAINAGMITPEDMNRALSTWDHYLQGLNAFFELETSTLDQFGNERWMLARGRVTEWDNNGVPLYASGTVMNITQLRRAESDAADYSRILESILENLPIIIVKIGFDQTIQTVLGKGLELSSYPNSELVGRSITKLLPDITPHLEKAFSGQPDQFESSGSHKGKKWYFQNYIMPDNNGAICVLIDITQQKLYEEKLHNSRSQLLLAQKIGKAGSWVFDLSEKQFEGSEEAKRIYGLNPEIPSYSMKTIISQTHPEDRKLVMTAIRGLLKNSDEYNISYRIHQPTTDKWIHVQSIGIFDAARHRVIGTIRDITEETRTLEALRESEAKYRTIINTAPDGVQLTDKNLNILAVSPRFLTLLGYKSEEELLGKSVMDMISKEEADAIKNGIDSLMSGSTRRHIPHKLLRKDGSSFYCEISSAPIFDDVGEIIGFVSTFRDVTERLKVEEEQRKFQEQLQQTQKLESLGVLAGGIAHDFNNLLVGILGNAELAQMELSPESSVLEFLHAITTAATRAADLSKQMLAYSGKGKFVIDTVNLNAIVDEMTHMLEISISKSVVLNYTPFQALPSIEADATQLRQVIMNLVINASEAMENNSGVISIRTGVMRCDREYLKDTLMKDPDPEKDYIFLEVSDTGKGMSRGIRDKLFDPFFTTKFTGRGLGLAAVLGIIRSHDGGIKVTSKPGKGTTFRILLPVNTNNTDQPGDSREVILRKRLSGTVLLADDEQYVLAVGRKMLEKLGFVVITAKDGQEAVDIYKEDPNKFALVILDLTMPHMDGEMAYAEMQKTDPDVCVLLSSGYSGQEIETRFADTGIKGFVQKPYKINALYQEVIKALGDE